MRQLVTFWRISGEESPPSQVTRKRECLPVPNVICCHLAIQPYLAPQQFWGGRPPGLMVIKAFTFSFHFYGISSNFFLALGIGDALSKRIIINAVISERTVSRRHVGHLCDPIRLRIRIQFVTRPDPSEFDSRNRNSTRIWHWCSLQKSEKKTTASFYVVFVNKQMTTTTTTMMMMTFAIAYYLHDGHTVWPDPSRPNPWVNPTHVLRFWTVLFRICIFVKIGWISRLYVVLLQVRKAGGEHLHFTLEKF